MPQGEGDITVQERVACQVDALRRPLAQEALDLVTTRGESGGNFAFGDGWSSLERGAGGWRGRAHRAAAFRAEFSPYGRPAPAVGAAGGELRSALDTKRCIRGIFVLAGGTEQRGLLF